MRVRLRNVTRSFNFDCFSLTIASPGGPLLKFINFKDIEQELHGTVLSKAELDAARSDMVRHDWHGFMSGADAAVTIPVEGIGAPRLLVAACAKDKDKALPIATLRHPTLVSKSLSTFLVEYEIAVLWSVLLAWTAALLVVGVRSAVNISRVDTKSTGVTNEDISVGG